MADMTPNQQAQAEQPQAAPAPTQAPQAPMQAQESATPAFPISGNPMVDKFNDSLNEKHKSALQHIENSRQQYLQLLKTKKPTRRHTELGLGHLIVALAATALDPTKRAGIGFIQGVQQGQAQRDNDYNERMQNRYDQQMQLGSAKYQDELSDANRLLGEESQGRQRLDAYGKARDTERLKGIDDARKMTEDAAKEHTARIKQMNADINGFTKAYAAAPDTHIKHIVSRMFRNHFEGNKGDYAEAGFPDTTAMDQTIKEMEDKSQLPTLKEKNEASLEKTRAGNLKDRDKSIDTAVKRGNAALEVDGERIKKLRQDMGFADKMFPVKYATAEANLRKIGTMIEGEQARTAKTRASGAKGKSLIGGFSKEQMQWLHSQNNAISQTMRENQGYIKSAEKVISDNAFQARHGDKGAIARTDEAKKRRGSAQHYYDSLTKSVHEIRRKLGVPSPEGE